MSKYLKQSAATTPSLAGTPMPATLLNNFDLYTRQYAYTTYYASPLIQQG